MDPGFELLKHSIRSHCHLSIFGNAPQLIEGLAGAISKNTALRGGIGLWVSKTAGALRGSGHNDETQ
jgi:hypothetical protein